MSSNKKIESIVSLFTAVVVVAFSSFSVSAAEASVLLPSDDVYLQQTGMPEDVLQNMDNDFKAYIAADLKKSDTKLSRTGEASYQFDYVQTEIIPSISPFATTPDSGVSLTAYAFKSGSQISVYPTYEFTQDKKPKGRDAFSFQLGAAMRAYDFGGQVWYKDSSMSSWAVGGSMTANEQYWDGAVYSGTQLGTPDWSMKMKGCAWVHANVGTGTDKRIAMGYAYNPNKVNISVSFSTSGSVGLSFSTGSGTIYTTAKIVNLTY
ncbi:hypothetical protein HCH52_03325 [Oscillospiraceae bacterium HV4-5-C5C]|nr:hypothetical protein [Oscillospiraceae bacterium HV4-5-C5C]